MYRFDIGHPKQARQTKAIIETLGLKDDEIFLSAREGIGIPEVSKALGLEPLYVGGYYGSLYKKLVGDLLRAKRLADFAQVFPEDTVLISFGMPSGIRVAFGLGIPIIHINDTPHNEPVRRLTAPLSDYILTPLPEVKNRRDTQPRRAIIGYYGVPEMTYVPIAEKLMPGRPLERAKELVEEYSPFIFFRYSERKASYGLGSLREFYEVYETVKRIAKQYDLNVIVYQRYAEERVEGITIGREMINIPYLLRYARLVVSAGGSIAKEAAIQGVPTIATHYRLPQSERLRREGFPIYDGRENLTGLMTEILEKEDKRNVSLEKYEKLGGIVRRCLNLL